ncbi:biliverdin-producing heme oxygenase [Mariniflexile litorale]|uniref:Biliverdin-producing heme oxygenase n=1 Tax=Mariniflexile litorale TaxID=3045158 RepID=A0AAU7EBW2_9FLAO|nr:biliverdin-producing heme oxygenase [Mariniflexile sp. KMM 9835]MDQ8213442.1 biliverdin-producing heme oxygenase [Mariniflexile sp. KMM 9835]
MLNPSRTQDFLLHLKTQTAHIHKKLEYLPVSAMILSPSMEIKHYTRYLSLMYDVHKNLEATVFPLLSELIDTIKVRAKTPLIKEDLLFLHYNHQISKSVFKTHPLTIPFALGMLYVVEGSTLGGRFILKNIETVPGLDQGKGVSYFTGYGSSTGSMWKSFLNTLAQYEADNNCEPEIIEGALYAFECIYNHFLSANIDED